MEVNRNYKSEGLIFEPNQKEKMGPPQKNKKKNKKKNKVNKVESGDYLFSQET